MTTETYTGQPATALIASGTNPWVEVGGIPVDWTTAQHPAAANDCDQCAGSPVPGAIPAMDTPEGIQSCDLCQRAGGDLDAALALARLAGGVAKFTAAPRP